MRLHSKIILDPMNSIVKIVRFNILGRVTTSWTYIMKNVIYSRPMLIPDYWMDRI